MKGRIEIESLEEGVKDFKAAWKAGAAGQPVTPRQGTHFTSLEAAHLSAGTLGALPHNGTVLLLLKISGQTHRESYFNMVMTVIVSVIIALVAVLVPGSMLGSS